MDADEALLIGQRARMIRKRRGLGLDVTAGLAGISKPYLSLLERGQRGFNRRGLLDDLANALCCSVADLTGQPYLLQDRATADAMITVPGIELAIHECILVDVPDLRARPVAELAELARQANADCDQTQYALLGQNFGAVISELHVLVATGDGDTRRAALAALMEACIAASGTVRALGHGALAAALAQRGYESDRAGTASAVAGATPQDRHRTGHRGRGSGAVRRALSALGVRRRCQS